MEYKSFEDIFNQAIFEKSKSQLVQNVANYPERYIGLFRPTKPRAKIIQNLSQSNEICFGDAFETLISDYLEENDFIRLNKNLGEGKENLQVDQLFSLSDTILFIEQKIRDDHDSTKKRGQIENFEKKLTAITKKYPGKKIKGFFYFIDDSFQKNKRFYDKEISQLVVDYGCELKLCYGRDLFVALGKKDVWTEIMNHLKKWKETIPDLPEINFDLNYHTSFNEIKELDNSLFRKLFNNPELVEILKVIFPEAKTLELLKDHFLELHKSNSAKIHLTLAELTADVIKKIKDL